jgi:hypothetical protein
MRVALKTKFFRGTVTFGVENVGCRVVYRRRQAETPKQKPYAKLRIMKFFEV